MKKGGVLKKAFLGAGVAALSVFIWNSGWAAVAAHSIPISLTVVSRFLLEVQNSALEFGRVEQGNAARQDLHFAATTNHGVEWSVQMQADPIASEDGEAVLPPENFRFTMLEAPSGESVSRGAGQQVPRSMTTIYTADSAHYVATRAQFGLGFQVTVPEDQRKGRYSSSLTLRLIDSL